MVEKSTLGTTTAAALVFWIVLLLFGFGVAILIMDSWQTFQYWAVSSLALTVVLYAIDLLQIWISTPKTEK